MTIETPRLRLRDWREEDIEPFIRHLNVEPVMRWLAGVRTPEQQAQGLMNRQSLAPNMGMLFPYDPPQNASFWMKNTLIPLDIIFIRENGTVALVTENTVPLSLDPIPSLEPVAAVLEIAGGRAAELGIQAGDKVSWVR